MSENILVGKILTGMKIATMHDLGWFQPDVPETDEGDFGPYDPDDGWSCLV